MQFLQTVLPAIMAYLIVANAAPTVETSIVGKGVAGTHDNEGLQFCAFNATENALRKRSKSNINCCDQNGTGWKYHNTEDFKPIIETIAFNGPVILIPARTCLSYGGCRNGAEVFLCNDRTGDITPNARYLASYGVDIINRCNVQKQIFFRKHQFQTCGQMFDTDGYNVILRGC